MKQVDKATDLVDHKPIHSQPKKSRRQRKLIPIRQAIYSVLAFGLLAASIVMFFLETELSRPFFERPFNIYRIVVMALAVIFLLLATKGSWLPQRADDSTTSEPPRLAQWLRRLAIALPILALVCLVIQLAWPEFAAQLVRKESWPFYRNAIFIKCACQIVGLVCFIQIARRYARRHNWLATILSGLVALIFLVMAGEELSWGQRIFGWSTPANIAAGNAQAETNLHNFATQAFQNTLYFGGWVLLIAAAFWRNTLRGILSKWRPTKFLVDWLPPLSFVLIFAAGLGFGDPLHSETGLYYGSNLFFVIATLIILVALVVKYVHSRNDAGVRWALLVLLAYAVVLIGNQFFSQVWDANAGAVTEYLEVFISLGLMLWAITISSRLKRAQINQSA